MKKYKIIYVILFILLLSLICTKGITSGIETSSYGGEQLIMDGFYGSTILLIHNLILLICILSVSIVITFKKSNSTKYKIPILILIILLVLLIPITQENRSGGFAGIHEEKYFNVLNIKIYTEK